MHPGNEIARVQDKQQQNFESFRISRFGRVIEDYRSNRHRSHRPAIARAHYSV